MARQRIQDDALDELAALVRRGDDDKVDGEGSLPLLEVFEVSGRPVLRAIPVVICDADPLILVRLRCYRLPGHCD